MTEKKKLKNQKIAAVCLLLLLILLPLEFLNSKIEEILESSNKTNAAEAQNILHDEINEFRNDLKPKVFLKKFLQKALPPHELSDLFKAAHAETSVQARTVAYKKILSIVQDRLIAGNPPFEPLFLSVSDAELECSCIFLADKFKQTFSPEFQKPGLDFEKFYARYFSMFSFASYCYTKLSQNQHDIFLYFLKKYSLKKKNSEKGFFRGVISFFIKGTPIDRQVSAYFSDIYDYSNVLIYSHVENNEKEALGALNAGYLQTDLKPEKILESALGLSQKDNLRRFVSPDPKKNVLRENEMMRFEPISAGKETVFLGAILKLEQNENLRLLVNSYHFLRKLLLLLFLLIIAQITLFDFYLPMRLRFKLMIILSFAVVFPTMAGVALLSGISGNHSKIEKNLAGNFLESRLNKFELDYQEIINRQVLANFPFKLKFGHELEKHPLSAIDFQKFKNYLRHSIRSSNIYSADGSKIGLIGTRSRGRGIDRILGTYAVASLKNLGTLKENDVTRKDLQRLDFTMGMAGDVADAFDFAKVAGNEAEHGARLSGLNSLYRSIFYLLSLPKDPDLKVQTIGFFDLEPLFAFKRHLESRPGYPHRCFYERSGPYRSEVAIALRDTVEITDENWGYNISRQHEDMQNMFRMALNSRESGKLNDKIGGQKFLAWRFDETAPLIFAGLVEYDNQRLSDLFLWLLLILFPFFMFLALIFVSQLMNCIFLAPIEALSKAVNQISVSGDPDVCVEIASNDEFAQVETAFNQMTRGLMQKKHISRFVSQRLVNAIEQDSPIISRQSLDFSEMTILASDVRDFTTISENREPETVVEILNEYFTAMEEAIKKEGGIIDRFIGDAIIAVFQSDHPGLAAEGAVRAASGMRQQLQRLNEVFQQRFNLKIDNGVGIASGKALVANLGKSCERRDSTIVGEIVDRAEMLESRTKSGCLNRIILDENTNRFLPANFRLRRISDENEALKCYELEELVIYEEN